jgi:Zn-finger nucleic acid-binding protein
VPEEEYRPVCNSCGYRDTGTFTGMQLDAYDFQCPKCDGVWFQFVLERPAPSLDADHG